MSYVELHARSAFSFLAAASQPEALAREAAALGLPALALTDRGGVYGSARLHHAAQEAGVRALVGAELELEDGSLLPVLVQNRAGYQHLCRLLTDRHLGRKAEGLKAEGLRAERNLRHPNTQYATEPSACPPPPSPLPPFSLQPSPLPPSALSSGLLALTGGTDGPLHRAWERGGTPALAERLAQLRAAFGEGNLALEIQRHHRRGEEVWNRVLVDVAAATGLPLVATNGVLHARPQDRPILDVFTCLRHHTHLDAAGRLLSPNAERHLKNEAQMRELFADMPEVVAASGRLAERLEFTLENLGYEFPRFPVPPGESMDSFLAKLTWFGAEQRYGGLTPKVRRQLRHELDLIARLGFSGYFLVVWDIVTFAREQGILIQGRGSAANSAVCYSLGITAVDPVGQNLLFERFLSEGRKGWPDIDLDLPSGELRERVIQEVYRRHGERGAAMTANVITYRGRSAAREITKVLNLPAGLADRFSRLFAHGDFQHTLELRDQLAQAGLAGTHPRADAFALLYAGIYGLPRHLGQHSGGMVICQGALDSVVPLQPASMPGRVVVQWDKDDCEDLGIVKVDFLGLGMMAVLQDCLELTRERGRAVDLAHLPKDDPATYDLLCRADTIGTFQVESRAQQATLPRLQPRCFYDLVVEVAIIRPGPIQGKMVHPYLERRAGRQPVTYADPQLEPILGRTLGIALFQEQVLKIAMVLAGFSGSDAEELRRALGFHRNNERMDRSLAKLRTALAARGYTSEVMEDLVRQIRSFALYGFPESHAISFALISYASCWLKVHRGVEFYTALLNNQPMGFYSPATLVQDARRRGLRARPPCLLRSGWDNTVEDDHTFRIGLRMLRGLRRTSVERWKEAWAKAPAPTPETAPPLTPFTPAERRLLAAAGALNALHPHRRAALWAIEDTLAPRDDARQPELVFGADAPNRSNDEIRMTNGENQNSPDELQTPHPRLGPPGSRPASITNDPEAGQEPGAPREQQPPTSPSTPKSVSSFVIRASSLAPQPPSSFVIRTSSFSSPRPLTPIERVAADLATTGLTAGDHPMALLRSLLPEVWCASDLQLGAPGTIVCVAGAVICRQRPGTAKGVVFVSLEDETGIANVICHAPFFERHRLVITHEPFLRFTGRLQTDQGVIHIIAASVARLEAAGDKLPAEASHDFR